MLNWIICWQIYLPVVLRTFSPLQENSKKSSWNHFKTIDWPTIHWNHIIKVCSPPPHHSPPWATYKTRTWHSIILIGSWQDPDYNFTVNPELGSIIPCIITANNLGVLVTAHIHPPPPGSRHLKAPSRQAPRCVRSRTRVTSSSGFQEDALMTTPGSREDG